jgi:hypothetical protein
MRDLLSKVMIGSMIAGAALLVAACGGSEDATANNANYVADETLMSNDVTGVDAMNGTTDNLGMDAANTSSTSDAANTSSTTTDTTTTTNTTTTNGM